MTDVKYIRQRLTTCYTHNGSRLTSTVVYSNHKQANILNGTYANARVFLVEYRVFLTLLYTRIIEYNNLRDNESKSNMRDMFGNNSMLIHTQCSEL